MAVKLCKNYSKKFTDGGNHAVTLYAITLYSNNPI